MIRKTDEFYNKQTEPNQSCLLALRKIILDQNTDLDETVKYGMPCFTYKKKAFCYLWTDKKTTEPYILMVDGKLIDHLMLEDGSRSRMRIFRVNPHIDIPLEHINTILQLGLKLK